MDILNTCNLHQLLASCFWKCVKPQMAIIYTCFARIQFTKAAIYWNFNFYTSIEKTIYLK